jgi:hypothetical protein
MQIFAGIASSALTNRQNFYGFDDFSINNHVAKASSAGPWCACGGTNIPIMTGE